MQLAEVPAHLRSEGGGVVTRDGEKELHWVWMTATVASGLGLGQELGLEAPAAEALALEPAAPADGACHALTRSAAPPDDACASETSCARDDDPWSQDDAEEARPAVPEATAQLFRVDTPAALAQLFRLDTDSSAESASSSASGSEPWDSAPDRQKTQVTDGDSDAWPEQGDPLAQGETAARPGRESTYASSQSSASSDASSDANVNRRTIRTLQKEALHTEEMAAKRSRALLRARCFHAMTALSARAGAARQKVGEPECEPSPGPEGAGPFSRDGDELVAASLQSSLRRLSMSGIALQSLLESGGRRRSAAGILRRLSLSGGDLDTLFPDGESGPDRLRRLSVLSLASGLPDLSTALRRLSTGSLGPVDLSIYEEFLAVEGQEPREAEAEPGRETKPPQQSEQPDAALPVALEGATRTDQPAHDDAWPEGAHGEA